MHIALVEPEIPPNTGSIARLCAATETPLHLVGRLGFAIDDRHLRRAGLDYWPHVPLSRHDSWQAFRTALPGIATGVILGIGRSIAETAAVIRTAGSSLRLPTSLFSPARTLAVHFYILAREGISMERAYGTAALMIILILVINIGANALVNRFMARGR